MRLVAHNPRFGMDKYSEDDGVRIPIIDNLPNKVIVEMDFSCEGPVDDESLQSGSEWFVIDFSFKSTSNKSIFTEDFKFIFNYTRSDLWFFINELSDKKNTFEFFPAEPFGHLEVLKKEEVVDLRFHFDSEFYIMGKGTFGSEFFIELSISHEQFERFIYVFQLETQRAYDLSVERDERVHTSSRYAHETI